MTALEAGRNTKERDPASAWRGPVAAAVKCFAGGIAVRDAAGNLKPGVTATGLVVAGRFEEMADNSAGEAAAISVDYKPGVFRWANSADADEIAKAEIGDNCYLVDDQTVAKTSAGATRSVAGKIVDVDDLGVWVETGYAVTLAPGGALLAANNLSDVSTAATALANLGGSPGLGAPGFMVGAQGGDVINVAVQLKDVAGVDLAVRASLLAYLSDDANGDTVAGTAPSGGAAIGTDGVSIPLVAGKAFLLTSEADGDIDINITEAGADTWYLVLVMPNGRLAVSGAITFA